MYMPDGTDPLAFGYVPRRNRPGLLRAARYLMADALAFPLVGLGFAVGGALVATGMIVWSTVGRPS